MFSVKDIKKAINSVLKNSFPEIDIQSRDVEKGFKRPSFFVRLDNMRSEGGVYYTFKEMTCRILYFAQDRHESSIENMDTANILMGLFGLNFMVVNDEGKTKVITISDSRAQLVDQVLEFEFDFSFYQDNGVEDVSDLMQELELNNDG